MRVGLLILLLIGWNVRAATDPESPDPKYKLINAIAAANNHLAEFKEIQDRFANSLKESGSVCLRNWPKRAEEYAALEKKSYGEFYGAVFNVIDVPNHLNVPPIYPDVVCSEKAQEIQEKLTDILEVIHESQAELVDRIHKLQALQNEGFNKFMSYGLSDLNRSFRCMFTVSYANAVTYAFHGTSSTYVLADDSYKSDCMFGQSYRDLDDIKDAFDVFEGDVQADLRRFTTIKKRCD